MKFNARLLKKIPLPALVLGLSLLTTSAAHASCRIESSAANSITISTGAGCLADAGFRNAVTATIGRSMARLDAAAAPRESAATSMAEVEPTAQDRLRTLMYLNRTEAQMRSEARSGGAHYYGEDE